jgi:hypothetical protein
MEVNFFDKKGGKNILIIYRPYKGGTRGAST